MPIQNFESALRILNQASKILVPLSAAPSPDAVGCALATALYLEKFGKEVDIFYSPDSDHDQPFIANPPAQTSSNIVLRELNFLPGFSRIKNRAELPKIFVINLKTAKTEVELLSYEQTTPDTLSIHISPKSGTFQAQDVSFENKKSAYDLIIFFDTPSTDYLAGLYSNNTGLFFETPKINIDNHISSENYANINLIDITRASCAEITFELLKAMDGSRADADIATALLLGIVTKTESFTSSSTTPAAFLSASELVRLGGRQQEIIQRIFKTKNFPMLKLWGRAMARIKNLPEYGAIYTLLNSSDIEKAEASAADLPEVLHELVKNVSDANIIFLAAEHKEHDLELYIYCKPNIKLAEITNHFGGKIINAQLAVAELNNAYAAGFESMLAEAMQKLKSRLGL